MEEQKPTVEVMNEQIATLTQAFEQQLKLNDKLLSAILEIRDFMGDEQLTNAVDRIIYAA